MSGLQGSEFCLEGGAAALGIGELVFEFGDFLGEGFQSRFEIAKGLGELGGGAVEGGLLVAQGGLECGLAAWIWACRSVA